MKERIKLRNTFTARGKEQLRQSVTKKIEKIMNTREKKAG